MKFNSQIRCESLWEVAEKDGEGLMQTKPRAKRGSPKFERGDIVLVKMPEARADGAAFTVTGREYDRRFKIWFYHGANTCSYAESLLKRLENKAKTG